MISNEDPRCKVQSKKFYFFLMRNVQWPMKTQDVNSPYQNFYFFLMRNMRWPTKTQDVNSQIPKNLLFSNEKYTICNEDSRCEHCNTKNFTFIPMRIVQWPMKTQDVNNPIPKNLLLFQWEMYKVEWRFRVSNRMDGSQNWYW